MAEEAKDSPRKGGPPPCEYPEGALDLLKKLTDGKPGTRASDGWKTWAEIVQIMNEHFEPVNKVYHPKFTYDILQPKAVAQGWYTPAPPTSSRRAPRRRLERNRRRRRRASPASAQ